MALKESEAIVLRTYPLREADLLVTLFTRTEGKVRGVARSAKKSKRRFGGALEPLTLVKMLSLLCIIAGVIGLNAVGGVH